ncbi:MAG TPA: acyl-CoA reductase [Candidatus Baltobacteraceae bacterium]
MTALAGTPVRKIIAAVADAAQRWSDADFPPRVRVTERIAQRTRYAAPVVEYALDRLFFGITAATIESTIRAELGSLEILDDFTRRDGRPDAWAAPAGRVCIISSRTTIGVAIVPAIFALCAKCDVLVKDREDTLVGAFFDTLAEELDAFEGAAQATIWTANDEHALSLGTFDAVVAFGTEQTLRAISRSIAPGARLIGYGSRASAGYITRESLRDTENAVRIAHGAARDLVLYETEGCLSLHTLFVERGANVSLTEFGRILSSAIEAANVEFPVGERSETHAAQIAQQRDLAAFRAAGGRGCVFASEKAEYAVIVDQPATEPPYFLPRTIGIVAVDEPGGAVAYVREHCLRLEGFALSDDRSDAVQAAVQAGAARLARFGDLQDPPLSGDHGGRPRIAEFVRWIDRTL